jgi:hypothetical protein
LRATDRGIERITAAELDARGYVSPSERRQVAFSP